MESFNATFRRECLNVHWFESLHEAQAQIEAWRREYNASRPHRARQDQTPAEFAKVAAENLLCELVMTAGDSSLNLTQEWRADQAGQFLRPQLVYIHGAGHTTVHTLAAPSAGRAGNHCEADPGHGNGGGDIE